MMSLRICSRDGMVSISNFLGRSMARADSEWLLVLCLVALAVSFFQFHSSWQPPVDAHAFRQSQTALTALWLSQGDGSDSILSYATPIFGEPWKVPFEFPIYQAVVAGLAEVSGMSVAQSGRVTSAIFWMASLLPLLGLYRAFGLSLRSFCITGIFLLCSPLYLYYGRSILIESTAVFFGFCFMYLAVKAVASRQPLWWAASLLSGAACALVKVTTFPTFGLAAAACVSALPAATDADPVAYVRRIAARLLILTAIGLAILVLVLLWTRHTDLIKAGNPIASSLSSSALQMWNFGTISQRFEPQTWSTLIHRAISSILGSLWIVGLMWAGMPFLGRRRLWTVLFLLGLFLLPFLIFTNLHFVHDYYQFANGFWLILALGLVVSRWCDVVPAFWGYLTVLGVAVTQLAAFHATYYPLTKTATSPAMQLAEEISPRLEKDDVIVVVGDDWSPELAYFTGRRAIYIPDWLSPDTAASVFGQLSGDARGLLGPYGLGAVVVNNATAWDHPRNCQSELLRYLATLDTTPVQKVGSYRVYWK